MLHHSRNRLAALALPLPLLLTARTAAAQGSGSSVQPMAAPTRSRLDSLVGVGLQRNLARREQELRLDRARVAVAEARGLYLPSATVNARYTRVSGNTINLGDLVNPAFGALNELLQRQAFPTDLDLQLPLRQETSLRLAQPVFQPSILQANRLAGAAADAQLAERDAFVRQLDADLRTTYVTFARASRVVELHAATIALLDENVRVTEKLLTAGKVTPDAVLRARAERSAAVQQRDQAAQLADAARQSFAVALNAPIDEPIPLLPDSELVAQPLPPLDVARTAALTVREELRAMDHAKRAADARVRLAQGSFLPNVSVAFDYGVQGKDYRFDRSRDYTAFSVVMSWNVFNGGQDVARVQQASLDERRVETQRASLERQIELQVTTAWHAARVAQDGIATARERLDAARRTFELVRRRHAEGVATQLELLDARTTYTSASLNLVLSTYDAVQKRIDFDRAAALRRIGE